jgi:purine-cytosine permease-like protein
VCKLIAIFGIADKVMVGSPDKIKKMMADVGHLPSFFVVVIIPVAIIAGNVNTLLLYREKCK